MGGYKMVMPTKILENSMNKKISLLLKDSRILEGKLTGFDDYMNMVLEGTEETYNDEVRRLGTIIIRGNNVVSISPK
jgi:small nuclear ribonucleoprotein